MIGWRDTKKFWTQRINWDSFEFKVEALDEAKVIVINLFFDITSISDLNFFASNVSNIKGRGVEGVIYGCVRDIDIRTLNCRLIMYVDSFDEMKIT